MVCELRLGCIARFRRARDEEQAPIFNKQCESILLIIIIEL